MNKSLITSAITSLVVCILFFTFGQIPHSSQDPVQFGSNIETTRVLFGDGWKSAGPVRIGQVAGQFGTPITKFIATSTCNLIHNYVAQVASSSKAYDCFVLGARTGDIVQANFGTSTNSVTRDWAIIGSDASTTPNYITLKVYNLTGAPNTIPSELASTTKATIYRLSSKSSDYYQP